MTKEKYAEAQVSEMMSSKYEQEDENGNQYFLVYKPTFMTKKFEKLANYFKTSKDQMFRREFCGPIFWSPLSLKFGSDIFIKMSFFFFHISKVVFEISQSVLRIFLVRNFRVVVISYLVASLPSVCKQRYFYLLCDKMRYKVFIF